jgi:osmoprotectant transport system permease protein
MKEGAVRQRLIGRCIDHYKNKPFGNSRNGGFCYAHTLLWLLLCLSAAAQAQSLTIGSKKFTEGVILGEVATQQLRAAGFEAIHRAELGGTRILWNALVAGEIDVYAEYTGTLTEEIFAGQAIADLDTVLAAQGLRRTRPLGFNNTYAVGMKAERAAALGIRTLSDLRRHPGLRFGFSNEFMDRGDGWPALRDRYRLPQADVRGVDHDLGYRGLESGALDAKDLYSTDAEIAYYGLTVLEDDLRHFPEYQAVLLYRADLPPGAATALQALEGRLDAATMVRLNARAKQERVPEAQIAADFLRDALGTASQAVAEETRVDRLVRTTGEHLALVLVSLLAAVLVAVPLGIAAARYPALGQVILGVVGVLYTVPSLALLVLMIPLLGIGGPPALVALFLYSLLPIVRGVHTGLTTILAPLRESAEALGLSARVRLWQIDLPLASPSLLAGIQTSAVLNVGTATLGALVGAGGYGQPILTGIRLDDHALILEGAVPAAVLALVVQGVFTLLERLVIPKGLRL